MVKGIPSSSARAGSRQARARSRTPTCMPSVKSTLNRASSANCRTTGASAASGSRSSIPSPARNPATRNSTAVDSTLRRASSETSTASSSTTANTVTAIMAPGYPVKPGREWATTAALSLRPRGGRMTRRWAAISRGTERVGATARPLEGGRPMRCAAGSPGPPSWPPARCSPRPAAGTARAVPIRFRPPPGGGSATGGLSKWAGVHSVIHTWVGHDGAPGSLVGSE